MRRGKLRRGEKNDDENTELRCETVVIMVFIKKSSLNERATRNCVLGRPCKNISAEIATPSRYSPRYTYRGRKISCSSIDLMFHPTEFSVSPKSLAIRRRRRRRGGGRFEKKISRKKSLPHAEILENCKGPLSVRVFCERQPQKMVVEPYVRRCVAHCHKMIELQSCRCAREKSIGYSSQRNEF